jgi:hypothetical protein
LVIFARMVGFGHEAYENEREVECAEEEAVEAVA